ncbi:ATP-dependent nuclease [Paenarthrobacter nicotinovorans]|uniref:ATP-dependent nuclease n=1 Tax=Paenarthrobacter nicotinovorans TaxID=29320 RepID=UPI0037F232BD
MESAQLRVDALLETLNVARGCADEVRVGIRAFTLKSGDRVEMDAPGVTVIAGANNCGKSSLLSELSTELVSPGQGQNKIVGTVERLRKGSRNDVADWLAKHARVMGEAGPNPSFERLGVSVPVRLFQSQYGQTGDWRDFISHFFVRYLAAGDRETRNSTRKEPVTAPPRDPLQSLGDSKELMDELNAITYKILKQRLVLDDLNYTTLLRVGSMTVPYPARYEDPTDYQAEMESLPPLSAQGDGMRSLLNILIPLVTATYPVLIIDEPEAFLHPPQAFALGQELGRIASAKKVQVILATHDRHLLAGLVNADAPLSVVRLVRSADNTSNAYQLRSEDLRAIMKDPVLKYSHVLDGLFHEVVVLAEAERDCRFYEAALDAYEGPAAATEEAGLPIPVTEVLFIPTSGTSTMPRVARALRSLNVPVVVCADLDILDNDAVLKNILGSLGGTWGELAEDWKTVVAPLKSGSSVETLAAMSIRVSAVFDRILKENPLAIYDGENRKAVSEALKLQSRPWDAVKHHGVRELMYLNVGNTTAVTRLLSGLADQGVVVVHDGELESFGHHLGVPKGKNWLPAALEEGVQKSPEAQAHIRRLLDVILPLTSRGRA